MYKIGPLFRSIEKIKSELKVFKNELTSLRFYLLERESNKLIKWA